MQFSSSELDQLSEDGLKSVFCEELVEYSLSEEVSEPMVNVLRLFRGRDFTRFFTFFLFFSFFAHFHLNSLTRSMHGGECVATVGSRKPLPLGISVESVFIQVTCLDFFGEAGAWIANWASGVMNLKVWKDHRCF